MARVSTSRSRAAARDRIARQNVAIGRFSRWLEGNAGQVALVVALVGVLALTAWLEGHL